MCSALAFKTTDRAAKYTIKTCDKCRLTVNLGIYDEHQDFCNSSLLCFDITKVAAQAASVSALESTLIEQHNSGKDTKKKQGQELSMGWQGQQLPAEPLSMPPAQKIMHAQELSRQFWICSARIVLMEEH